MIDAPLAFFSFITLENADPAAHARYSKWHQMDHRPENLALPGVAWGDRWARPHEYWQQSVGSVEHHGTDYVAMYWFRRPVEESVRAWDQLGEDSFQWGRGPLFPGVRRKLLSFYRPIKGYAARSADVSPAVIPYRPNRGLHLTLSRFAEPHGPETHEHYRWEDQTLIPGLLELEGVAGAWTFSFSHHLQHATLPLSTDGDDDVASMRVRLLYLDDDPLTTSPRIRDRFDELSTHPAHGSRPHTAEEVLLSTPLRTIVPWQDW